MSRLLSTFRTARACHTPARAFASSARAANASKPDSLDLSDTSKLSPKQVLDIGFRRMREVPNYKKSDAELQPLLQAARDLGIPESNIRDIYDKTVIGTPRNANASPDTGFVAGSRAEQLFLLDHVKRKESPDTAHLPFQYDDIPSLGHLQLRDHRVLREYNRIAAYELPQLSQFATPYRKRTDKQVVKLRYTTYLGEPHPAESKVVASFKTNDLKDLTDAQRHKLRLLAGTRYDHEEDVVKISGNAFPEAAQNVNYIGDIIRNLLKESKDGKDTFADIPLRTSHVEARKRRNKSLYPQHTFPEAWKRPQDAPRPKEDVMTKLVEEYVKTPAL
jgi:small subunit ribosomal protein S35